ncbi:unnamed protein product [Moneuplotes crassus]|uniref:Palmitoyltransferase n=1 Tax=Euplotes crassus TaxID=5936 RepID=A0AAD1UGD3_EUPCR|nr:unnamed protein product [Moneuplotes crassus]
MKPGNRKEDEQQRGSKRDSNESPPESSKEHELHFRSGRYILDIPHGNESSYNDHSSLMQDEQPGNNDLEINKKGENPNESEKQIRNHGCMFPLHPKQLWTWEVIFVLSIVFILFLAPGIYYFPLGLFIFICIIYGLLLIGIIVCCLKVTLTDPVDRNVLYVRCEKSESVIENQDLSYFCDRCDAYVHERAQHCLECNKCVDMFDNHCKFLNNCIGGKNYIEYFLLLFLVMAKTLFFMMISFIFIITALASKEKFQEGFYKLYSNELANRFVLALFILVINALALSVVLFIGRILKENKQFWSKGITSHELQVYQDRSEKIHKEYEQAHITKSEYEEKMQELGDINKRRKRSYIKQIKSETQKVYKKKLLKFKGQPSRGRRQGQGERIQDKKSDKISNSKCQSGQKKGQHEKNSMNNVRNGAKKKLSFEGSKDSSEEFKISKPRKRMKAPLILENEKSSQEIIGNSNDISNDMEPEKESDSSNFEAFKKPQLGKNSLTAPSYLHHKNNLNDQSSYTNEDQLTIMKKDSPSEFSDDPSSI